MKKTIITAILASICVGPGCVSPRSPVTLPPSSNRTGLGETATLGVTTMAGAAAGYAVRNDGLGAAVGAGAGLLAGAVINNVTSARNEQRDAELVEAARRAERVKIQQEYWEAERMEKQGGARDNRGIANRNVAYQGGYFEGVNVAPRQGGMPTALDEPKRP